MSKTQQNNDYYFNEQGLLVFTESYHLKRGYCCGNGCKHCPYEYQNVSHPQKKQQLLIKQKQSRNKSG